MTIDLTEHQCKLLMKLLPLTLFHVPHLSEDEIRIMKRIYEVLEEEG